MPNINDVMEMVELFKSKSVIAMEDRCVAVRNRNAKCHKCVDACMVDAITVEKNKIAIDAGACMGCGACVAVCPTAAIEGLDPMDEELAASLASSVGQAQGIAVVACARMAARQLGDPDAYATVPCLGRVDEALFTGLAARGMEDIVLVDGDCSTCKYGKVSPLVDDTVESAARLFELCGSGAIITRTSEFPPEVKAQDARKAVGAARRSFFTSAGGYARNVAMTAAEKAMDEALNRMKEQKLLTLRDRLGAGKSGKLPTFEAERNMRILDDLCAMGEPVLPELDTRLFGMVAIDVEKCSGCGMCVTFCPTGALRHSETDEPADEGREYLEFQAADCTQCRLCLDACLRSCMEVTSKVPADELFDFEPRLIEIPRPKKKKPFGRR